MPHLPRYVRFTLLLAGFLFAGSLPVWATHNRAGEISIRQEGDCATSLRIRATITTYTKASSTQADRDTLTICWGDGRCEQVARVNGPGNPHKGELLENDTRKNIYIAYHTYPARGTYVVSMTDPNRNGGILNVNFPNSEQIKFYIQTTYTFPNPQFQGCNNTPVLLQPPIDIGCVGQPFIHNPNAYDTDGDSLSYHLTTPLQDVGLKVPNYLFPDNINPGPRNKLTINPVTGDIVWDAPQRAGEYNLAMIIVEYRDGIPIDTIIRDLQILILECDNLPPLIETPFQEICVVAGQVLEFAVRATAPASESRQKVKLSALGGPFETSINPASFSPESTGYENQPAIKVFRWETDCSHISDQYYSVVFRAVDNFFTRDSTGLSTLKTIRIKVVGPPPEGLRAESSANVIEVSWNKPYLCDDPLDNYFRGFTVWRREGGNAFLPDTCNPGLQGKGYEKLTEFSVLQSNNNRYVYYDRTAEPGKTYCYRVLAEFARLTPNGKYAFNLVESLPSREICLLQNRDLPLLLTTSVQATDPVSGAVLLCWSKPVDLDTLSYPGPYTYQLLRSKGQSPAEASFEAVGSLITTPYLNAPTDTCYLDSGINTQTEAWTYKIQFFTGISTTKPLGLSAASSTLFLELQPTDRAMNLSWKERTAWNNFRYVIERKNGQGSFDSIGTTTQATFVDQGLENGIPVCYRIRSIGTYGIPNLTDPLINWSQEACATPLDNVPPCPPILEVHNICETPEDCDDANALANNLRWKNPVAGTCNQHIDIAGYRIYYSAADDQPLQVVDELERAAVLTYSHQPTRGLTGCYAVSAFDNLGNESALSEPVCVDNCPHYQLPNTFTPNGDGQNDVFVPYPFCFIEQIDLKVFNRWGELVFQTSDPHINWQGTNLQGKELPSGVYSYVCRVFEQRLAGAQETEVPLSGFIQLLR